MGMLIITIKINYLFSGDDSSKKVNMSDYELRGPSHVRDISNIVNKLLYLHKKVVIWNYNFSMIIYMHLLMYRYILTVITIIFSPLGCFQSPWWCISMVWRRENDQGNNISHYSQQISPDVLLHDCWNLLTFISLNFIYSLQWSCKWRMFFPWANQTSCQ